MNVRFISIVLLHLIRLFHSRPVHSQHAALAAISALLIFIFKFSLSQHTENLPFHFFTTNFVYIG